MAGGGGIWEMMQSRNGQSVSQLMALSVSVKAVLVVYKWA